MRRVADSQALLPLAASNPSTFHAALAVAGAHWANRLRLSEKFDARGRTGQQVRLLHLASSVSFCSGATSRSNLVVSPRYRSRYSRETTQYKSLSRISTTSRGSQSRISDSEYDLANILRWIYSPIGNFSGGPSGHSALSVFKYWERRTNGSVLEDLAELG